jgi:hydroxyacylglutathione hydrolase
VIIRQIRNGIDNFSYLVYCEKTGKAALVDPGTNASECMREIGMANLELVCVINTHHHSDHTAENSRVKETYGCDIIASRQEPRSIPGLSKTVDEGEVIMLGHVELKFMIAPGHTPGGLCIIVDNHAILTGDTLFIGDCGRTDLSGGSNRQMFDTLQRIKSLPDEMIVYPGHDYGDIPFDTIGNQKKHNKTLKARTIEELSGIG